MKSAFGHIHPFTMPLTDLPTRRSTAARNQRQFGSDSTLASQSIAEEHEQYTLSTYRPPSELPRDWEMNNLPRTMDSKKLSSYDTESSKTTAVDLEAGDARYRRRRVSSAPEDHGFFSSIRDTDADNNWDDLDDVDLHENEDAHGGEFDDELYEQVVEPDDPAVTGAHKQFQEDYEDIEKQMVREMSYKQRRKALSRIKIEYNISCKSGPPMKMFFAHELPSPAIVNREKFLLKLAKALMTFGAPSHRIEAQLISASHILEIEAEFIHVPGLIMCSFLDKREKSSETHFIRCSGRMALGRLHEVHQLYRKVVHDELSAKKAGDRLDEILAAPPIYGPFVQCMLNFWIAALICPLAFGGSIVDMWVAGAAAVFLSAMRIGVISRAKKWYAHVFE